MGVFTGTGENMNFGAFKVNVGAFKVNVGAFKVNVGNRNLIWSYLKLMYVCIFSFNSNSYYLQNINYLKYLQ